MRLLKQNYFVRLLLWLVVQTLIFSSLYYLGFELSKLDIQIHVTAKSSSLSVDGHTIPLSNTFSQPWYLSFVQPDPLQHEFQIDSSDSINNSTFDPNYFKSIQNSMYYRFQDWMRGGSDYSQWQNLMISNGNSITEEYSNLPASNDIPVPAINSSDENVDVTLLHPEASANMNITFSSGEVYSLIISRSDRNLELDSISADGKTTKKIFQSFFPDEPWPFIGENIMNVCRILISCTVIIALMLLLQLITGILFKDYWINKTISVTSAIYRFLIRGEFVPYFMLLGSLGFTIFISFYDFHLSPHVLDAQSYYFQAKIFALGKFNVPVPAAYPLVNGPFMVASKGKWFTQFAPGTSLVLALGFFIHLPWIIEPVLGTASLWAIYQIIKKWFGYNTALLTLMFLILSPFYSFLAASFMSHTITLFFLSFEAYFIQLFSIKIWEQYKKKTDGRLHESETSIIVERREKQSANFFKWKTSYFLFLAAICAGAAFLTRELTGALLGGLLLIGIPAGYFNEELILAYKKRIHLLHSIKFVLKNSPVLLKVKFYTLSVNKIFTLSKKHKNIAMPLVVILEVLVIYAVLLYFVAFSLGSMVLTKWISSVQAVGVLVICIPVVYFHKDLIDKFKSLYPLKKTGRQLLMGAGNFINNIFQKKICRFLMNYQNTIVVAIVFSSILVETLILYAMYNHIQTGDFYTLPRQLFFPDDKLGYGNNIGFYGKNTFAAGQIIIDQLLTILQIDLYGWPFAFTLAFIPIPFIFRMATRWDWFALLVCIVTLLVYGSYYYHGIALGPRFLYETLPFLGMLTSRGVISLKNQIVLWCGRITSRIKSTMFSTNLTGWPVYLLVGVCLACNLIYYLPRNIQMYQNYANMGYGSNINLDAIYNLHRHNSVITTSDGSLYNNILFMQNDPLMNGDIVFALAQNSEDIANLHAVYPNRNFYSLQVGSDGKVSLSQE